MVLGGFRSFHVLVTTQEKFLFTPFAHRAQAYLRHLPPFGTRCNVFIDAK